MVITLIGYRGSGKSSLAPALATALGWNWIDADVELEARAGKTIRQIFEQDGEPAFRKLEHDILAELLQRDKLIIAAGGGAIMNPDTRSRMKGAGPVIWLQASLETLATRIFGDATTAERRPNLTAQGGVAEIALLLATREPLYRETASLTVDTTSTSLEDMVYSLLEQLPTGISRGDRT